MPKILHEIPTSMTKLNAPYYGASKLNGIVAYDTEHVVIDLGNNTYELKSKKSVKRKYMYSTGTNFVPNECRLYNTIFANENYALQEGDTKTYVTTSVAYLAQHANINCMHEPWLHLRRCQRLVMRGREIVSNEIGYVVYIWDTREVVQWIDAKQSDTLSSKTPKAVDNAKPLKDVKHLLPDWVTEDVKRSGNLWSMANMPKEVQDMYYSR